MVMIPKSSCFVKTTRSKDVGAYTILKRQSTKQFNPIDAGHVIILASIESIDCSSEHLRHRPSLHLLRTGCSRYGRPSLCLAAHLPTGLMSTMRPWICRENSSPHCSRSNKSTRFPSFHVRHHILVNTSHSNTGVARSVNGPFVSLITFTWIERLSLSACTCWIDSWQPVISKSSSARQGRTTT
jgi:hypothetical protein